MQRSGSATCVSNATPPSPRRSPQAVRRMDPEDGLGRAGTAGPPDRAGDCRRRRTGRPARPGREGGPPATTLRTGTTASWRGPCRSPARRNDRPRERARHRPSTAQRYDASRGATREECASAAPMSSAAISGWAALRAVASSRVHRAPPNARRSDHPRGGTRASGAPSTFRTASRPTSARCRPALGGQERLPGLPQRLGEHLTFGAKLDPSPPPN